MRKKIKRLLEEEKNVAILVDDFEGPKKHYMPATNKNLLRAVLPLLRELNDDFLHDYYSVIYFLDYLEKITNEKK